MFIAFALMYLFIAAVVIFGSDDGDGCGTFVCVALSLCALYALWGAL